MMKKNKILFFLGFMLAIANLSAQHMPKNLPNYDYKKWHFGFTLGMNTMNFNIFPVDQQQYIDTIMVIQPSLSQGFNIGIVANMKMAKYLDLRFVPTLSFGQRNLNYVIKTGQGEEGEYSKTVESTFLDFPLTVKYKSKRFEGNLNNMRAYVLAGGRYSLDLASQKDKQGTSDEVVLKLNPHDLMVTGGVGFEFYLAYFKLGVEFQMAYGLINVLDDKATIYTTNVEKLTSRMGWITFTFE